MSPPPLGKEELNKIGVGILPFVKGVPSPRGEGFNFIRIIFLTKP